MSACLELVAAGGGEKGVVRAQRHGAHVRPVGGLVVVHRLVGLGKDRRE